MKFRFYSACLYPGDLGREYGKLELVELFELARDTPFSTHVNILGMLGSFHFKMINIKMMLYYFFREGGRFGYYWKVEEEGVSE